MGFPGQIHLSPHPLPISKLLKSGTYARNSNMRSIDFRLAVGGDCLINFAQRPPALGPWKSTADKFSHCFLALAVMLSETTPGINSGEDAVTSMLPPLARAFRKAMLRPWKALRWSP